MVLRFDDGMEIEVSESWAYAGNNDKEGIFVEGGDIPETIQRLNREFLKTATTYRNQLIEGLTP